MIVTSNNQVVKVKKKPTFSRTDSHKKKRLGIKWRRPKGIQNKRRLQIQFLESLQHQLLKNHYLLQLSQLSDSIPSQSCPQNIPPGLIFGHQLSKSFLTCEYR